MSGQTSSVDELIAMAVRLSSRDKVKLLERVTAALQEDMNTDEQPTAKRSLYGLWAGEGIDISTDEIDEARREMWGNFPREDI